MQMRSSKYVYVLSCDFLGIVLMILRFLESFFKICYFFDVDCRLETLTPN